MNLTDVSLGKPCVVKKINVLNHKTKLRIMELGLNIGCHVVVENISVLKKTLLVNFYNSCFTLKRDVAKFVEVAYE